MEIVYQIFFFLTFDFVQFIKELVVDNGDQGGGVGGGGGGGEVIEEPEFQPEVNQIDDDQIGAPQPKQNQIKFNGIHALKSCLYVLHLYISLSLFF